MVSVPLFLTIWSIPQQSMCLLSTRTSRCFGRITYIASSINVLYTAYDIQSTAGVELWQCVKVYLQYFCLTFLNKKNCNGMKKNDEMWSRILDHSYLSSSLWFLSFFTSQFSSSIPIYLRKLWRGRCYNCYEYLCISVTNWNSLKFFTAY
jgi:hypothetical protein